MAKVIDTAAIQPGKANSWPKIFAAIKAAPFIPLSIIVVFVLAAILADLVTFHDAYQVSLRNRLIPPFWQDGGSLSHPLGTDPLGRDVLTRIIYGARISIIKLGRASCRERV